MLRCSILGIPTDRKFKGLPMSKEAMAIAKDIRDSDPLMKWTTFQILTEMESLVKSGGERNQSRNMYQQAMIDKIEASLAAYMEKENDQ